MATNHFDRRGITPPAIYKQQFFVVCGPPSVKKRNALSRFLRKHWGGSVMLVLAAFFLAGQGWARYDYVGATTLSDWYCEGLAGGLSLFAIYLYRTFRHWGLERQRRVKTRYERSQEINALLCTPPPLSSSVQITPDPEFAFTVEHWDSHAPSQLSEDSVTQTMLSDELIAPDALVLNVEVKKAA